MKRTTLIMALFSYYLISQAQVTDPMITHWWFNLTHNTYNGIVTDVDVVHYDSAYVYVHSSDVPNYYRDGQSVNNATDENATWQIPRVGQASGNPTGVMGGQMGLMIDGSVFFHPGDARSYNNAGVWNQLAYYFEGVDMDSSNGHSTPTNMYHHHFDNLKLHGWDSTQHSPIVGFAWDGYPLYGPFAYANTDGTGGIKRMVSSYGPKSYTTRTNGPNVGGQYPIGCYIEDWQYNAGSGDLDEHNGRFCVTPEYPNGTYAYFTTVDASYNPYYPYFIGPTFYGKFTNTNLGPTGGAATVPGTATLYTPLTTVNAVAEIEEGIELFPTPVKSTLTIQLKENKDYSFVMYDVKGSVVEKQIINTTTQIDMSKRSYGVYFVQLSSPDNSKGFIKRIVKQ